MRIALCAVQIPFVRGGAEFLCDNLYNELIKRKHEVEYIRIPFKWYPPPEIVANSLIWDLLDLSESSGTDIDIVIATKFPSYYVRHPNKVIWLIHQHRSAYDHAHTEFDDLITYGKIGEIVGRKICQMDNKCLRDAKKIFTISQNVTNRLMRYNKIRSNVLYPPPPYAGKYSSKEYENYIFFPSRLDSTKRQDLVIRSMRYVKSNLRLKIAGTGPLLNDYIRLAKDYNVEDKVDFLGHVSGEEIIELYAKAFCIAYTPRDEDLGYVTMESFFSKRPVITCTDSGGVLEFVEDNINGYITAPDPERLAGKIDLLYRENNCREMGENGYNKIKSMNLSWDSVIDNLLRTNL